MKDKIIQLFRLIIWVLLMIYVYYLYTKWVVISPENNVIMMLFVSFIWVFMIVMWIHPLCIKKARYIQFFLWIFLILVGNYYLKDDPSKSLFLADIIKILWVLLTIAWPMWICVPEKCKKKEEEAKIEIIEV